MEIFGVGAPEIALIVLIALILLGPKDMVAAGRTIGKTLRTIMTSPAWMIMKKTGEEIQQLPIKLAREAGLDEIKEETRKIAGQIQTPILNKPFDEAILFSPKMDLKPAAPSEETSVSEPADDPQKKPGEPQEKQP